MALVSYQTPCPCPARRRPHTVGCRSRTLLETAPGGSLPPCPARRPPHTVGCRSRTLLQTEHFGACTSSLLPSCLQRVCASRVFQASWSTSANIQAQAELSRFKWSCPTDPFHNVNISCGS
ncbi:uncharacterized protein AAG666_007227 isoform 1-T2 [Megaptera novaeangliae]